MGYFGEREKAKGNSSSSDLEGQIERGPGEHFSKRGHNEVMSNQLTKEERRLERKLVRKIDQRVIPLTVSLYLLVLYLRELLGVPLPLVLDISTITWAFKDGDGKCIVEMWLTKALHH